MKVYELSGLYTVTNTKENFKILVAANESAKAREIAIRYFKDSNMSYDVLIIREFQNIHEDFDCDYVIMESQFTEIENKELMETLIEVQKQELEDYLQGLAICDYITKYDMVAVLEDFDEWAKKAKLGDTYTYNGMEYTLSEN